MNRAPHRRAFTAAGLTLAALLIAACADSSVSPDAQRDVMVDATRVFTEEVRSGLMTDLTEVTDDGTAPHRCADGGTRYTYVSVVGPAEWENLASSPVNAASAAETRLLGTVLQLDTDLVHTSFPTFDSVERPDVKVGEPSTTTYSITEGENKGITLAFTIAISEDSRIRTDIVGSTRCG